MSKENRKNTGKTILSIGKSLIKYIIAIVIICVILVLIGVDISTIFAGLGVVALIFGFGAESLIADLVTGLFLMVEGEYKIGEIIEVEGFRGEVVDVGIRTTSLQNAGGDIKIINNSKMINVLNRSGKDSRAITDIGIAYEEKLVEVEKMLPDMLKDIWERDQKLEPDKQVFLNVPEYKGVQALSESAVVLRFTAETKEKDLFNATRRLNRDLLVAFQEAGIKIPYTQIEIHSK
ncbi:MAG: mechanosensitive ion channel family protein [Lachnospiraceae bacterium]|nr:mechanosensitive ion channel family protein [Lachnospiraceae bacterium]